MSRDILIDENSAWDWNSGDLINKPLIIYGIDEEIDEVEVESIVDIWVKAVEFEEGMASTNHRPQRTRVRPTRLQVYELTADDEVMPNGEVAHFSLLANAKPINYIEVLKNT